MAWYQILLNSPVPETIILTTVLTTSIFFIAKNNTSLVPTGKQLSWLLGTLQALILTLASIPQLYLLIRNNFDLSVLTPSSNFSKVILTLFTTTLSLDLVLGVIYYPTHIQFLTGWFHHTVYIVLNLFLLYWDLAGHFLLLCPLELPTLILGLGQLNKAFRSDFWFGWSYFCTRIVYHFVLMSYFYLYGTTLTPSLVLLSIFPLHLFWFRGFILQQRRIKRKLVEGRVDNKALDFTSPLLGPLELDCKYSVEASLPSPIHIPNYGLSREVNPLDGVN